MSGWSRWLIGIRPRTLPAAVVPVLVGSGVAAVELEGVGQLIWWRVLCAATVALALQVLSNLVNDRSDGLKGTDGADRVGPPRLVGSGLATAGEVGRAAVLAGAVAAVAGSALALAVGPELWIVGGICLVAGWAYTGGPAPYAYLGLGEVFVFIFFGVVATVGSAYVQIDGLSGDAAILSVGVGALATALLVTNNLRDIEGDRQSAKLTLAVRIGQSATRALYIGLVIVGLLTAIFGGIVVGPWVAAGVLAAVVARRPVAAVRAGADGLDLIPVLGDTAATHLAFGVLVTLGCVLVAGW